MKIAPKNDIEFKKKNDTNIITNIYYYNTI